MNSRYWGRVTQICAIKLNSIGSDNGLSPGRRQAIIWTNAGILLIWPLGTNLSEILIEIYTFSFKKIRVKMSSEKWRPFCIELNVLMYHTTHFGVQPSLPHDGVHQLHFGFAFFGWSKADLIHWATEFLFRKTNSNISPAKGQLLRNVSHFILPQYVILT